MTPKLGRAVIDASVAVKLFVEEPLSDKAHALFLRLARDPDARFFVPDFFYVECANALWKLVRRHAMPPGDATRHVANLGRLRLERVPSTAVVGEAIELALRLDISVYDASYAATATLAEAPLVTSDDPLFRKLDDAGEQVIRLADIPDGRKADGQ
jgi:predicted nucleic acid-binding protein